MTAIKFIIAAIILVGAIWLIGLIPRWITNSLISIVLIILIYIMYRIDKDLKK